MIRLWQLCARRAPLAVPNQACATADGAAGLHTRPDHLTRTAAEPRQELIADAVIVAVHEQTPTVRELEMQVADAEFTFRPGNWVDLFIEDVTKVGGYSICSIPAQLPRLRLAVKQSDHPPAAWCHSEAAVPGASVRIKAGGRFSWDAEIDSVGVKHLLLIAGGIGVNPLYSVLQAVSAARVQTVPDLGRITLLYSASRPSELAFRGHLEKLSSADPRIRLVFYVTRNSDPEEPWAGMVGRIGQGAVEAAIAEGGVPASGVLAYVCGPPAMTDQLVEVLKGHTIALADQQVRFEKWW